MTHIAFIPLTPLGDSVLLMGELTELRRLYAPCEITVFAIPLIAELYSNFSACDRVVKLEGGIHGEVALPEGFNETFDIVLNHGYEPWWTEMVRKLKAPNGRAYGMEEVYRSADECSELFDKWVSSDYWKTVTVKRWPHAGNQMAELIRLVSPDYAGDPVRLSCGNYHCAPPENIPDCGYVLFLPGTSAQFKVYPLAKVEILADVLRRLGFKTVFALGPQDEVCKAVLSGKGIDCYSNLPLSQLAWLSAHARLVIGNDSGPMHFAASFDVPTMHFFSFSGADTWFSYGFPRHRIMMPRCGIRNGLHCGDCPRTCIGKTTICDAVLEACDLLQVVPPPMKRIAYFAQDLIGDALVWANMLEALARIHAPCEVVVFCPKALVELFDCMAFCDQAVGYDSHEPWSDEESHGFGHFDWVVNTRYDADSVGRLESLDHEKACGFENIDIPEDVCRRIYTSYIPLSRWDDLHLRRETSVTEQGAELIRLFDPGYHCDFVSFDKTTFVHEAPVETEKPRVVFVLGASNPGKNWGMENFLGVARSVASRGLRPLFFLGPKEQENASRIAEAGFKVKTCLPFSEIAGYFDPEGGTVCVVGNDTGLMHLACMLGAPSITISPFGSQFTWFPYAGDRRAVHRCLAPKCSFPLCVNRCVNISECADKIAVEEVVEAASSLLSLC